MSTKQHQHVHVKGKKKRKQGDIETTDGPSKNKRLCLVSASKENTTPQETHAADTVVTAAAVAVVPRSQRLEASTREDADTAVQFMDGFQLNSMTREQAVSMGVAPWVIVILSSRSAIQHSKAWYDFRDEVSITTTSIGPVCNESPYKTCEEALREKCGQCEPFVGNEACDHGTYYEPIACSHYEKQTGEKVFELGILRHPNHSHLAGSPDGLTAGFDAAKTRAIEIKCPLYRTKIEEVPKYYVPQVQLMMDIFNSIIENYISEHLDEYEAWPKFYDGDGNREPYVAETHFVQYLSKKKDMTVNVVRYDPGWLPKRLERTLWFDAEVKRRRREDPQWRQRLAQWREYANECRRLRDTKQSHLVCKVEYPPLVKAFIQREQQTLSAMFDRVHAELKAKNNARLGQATSAPRLRSSSNEKKVVGPTTPPQFYEEGFFLTSKATFTHHTQRRSSPSVTTALTAATAVTVDDAVKITSTTETEDSLDGLCQQPSFWDTIDGAVEDANKKDKNKTSVSVSSVTSRFFGRHTLKLSAYDQSLEKKTSYVDGLNSLITTPTKECTNKKEHLKCWNTQTMIL